MSLLPIRLQQAPRFVAQTLQRQRVLQRPAVPGRRFRLCYFSCQSYFRYLYCALHSLTTAAATVPFEVWVFSDNDQPLSALQIEALEALIPGLRVIPWPKSMGWGATQIGWIWRAYAMAAEGAGDDDIIARVDSDVFFFNDRILQAALRSDADFIGDGHFVDFQYCQGGCYFLRASAVRKVVGWLQGQSLEALLAKAGITVEDIAAQHFADQLGLRTWMTWFMMFPDELRNAGGLTAWQRWKFSCAHFVMKNKAAMIEAYVRDVLPASERARFESRIDVD